MFGDQGRNPPCLCNARKEKQFSTFKSVLAAQTSPTSIMTTPVMASHARNQREEGRRITPGQLPTGRQRLIRQFLLDLQPPQLTFPMSLPLQSGLLTAPPHIPGCHQPESLPRDHHEIGQENEDMGAVRLGQHSGRTEGDSPSLTNRPTASSPPSYLSRR